jgi:rod shape-determining protein MreB and related proteins
MFGIFGNFFKRISQDIGIDLGTVNTLVYVRGKGVVVSEPSVVAINRKTNTVIAVGVEAEKMYGRTPAHIDAIHPLVDGVISDFEITEEMLRYFLNQAVGGVRSVAGPRVVIGVPSGITNVEARAVIDAASHAGAREVYLIEEPMAAAIGVGLPVTESTGSMIVDIGGGTTDVAVISLSGVVVAKSIKTAGNHWNTAIVQYVRDVYKLAIGEKTAEQAKIELAAALSDQTVMSTAIRGRDLATGLPREITITSTDVLTAIDDNIRVIILGIKEVLEKTPPELLSDILHNGMYLAGGGSLIRGLDKRISQETGMIVMVANDPLTAVARGAGMVLEDLSKYKLVILGEEMQYGEILVEE